MNIFRPQIPYQFKPPRYSPLLAPILTRLSQLLFLRRKFRIRDMRFEGLELVANLVRERNTVLVAPNHADHADPHVLVCLGRRNGLAFHFMAAREGFETSPWNSLALQLCGAFSVDREGADISAIKTAMTILRDARYPLVVFPEGEIYHHQERLDPLNEGVATIILRAASNLPEDRAAYLVPAALIYTYDSSVESSFSERLNALEERITWKPREDMDLVDRIYRLGEGLVALKEFEFLGHTRSGNLVDRLSNLQAALVSEVEARYPGRGATTGSIPERVKALRGRIRKQLIDPDFNLSEKEEFRLYDDLDTLFVAVQLYSYPGQYLRESSSTQRVAETILKLEEDVLEEAVYASPRDVDVKFGEPIEIGTFLRENQLSFRTAVGPLTALVSERIQTMLLSMR